MLDVDDLADTDRPSVYAIQLRAIDRAAEWARRGLEDAAVSSLEHGPAQALADAGAERIRVEITPRRGRGHSPTVVRFAQDGSERVAEASALAPALRRAERAARAECAKASGGR